MDNYVPMYLHDEFAKRIDEEQRRQDKRIELVEQNQKQIQQLAISMEKLAFSMEQMAKEQKKQGTEIEQLKDVPRKSWDTIKYGILGAISAAIGAGIAAAVIHFIT